MRPSAVSVYCVSSVSVLEGEEKDRGRSCDGWRDKSFCEAQCQFMGQFCVSRCVRVVVLGSK
jgi:hypothetical protein